MHRAGSLIIGAALLAAQAAAQSTSDTIDVIGRKPEEARKQAQQFVRATGVAQGEQPVARWLDPVCPRAVGVSEEIARKVERRIRNISKEAHIRVARARCEANLTVAFTDDAGAVTRQVAHRSQTQFDNVAMVDRKAMYQGSAPIRWWHTVELRTSDGMRPTGNDAPPALGLVGLGSTGLGGQVLQQYRPSFLRTQVVRALTSASVIVDVRYAKGKMLDSIADYAALVGLAEIRPIDPPPKRRS